MSFRECQQKCQMIPVVSFRRYPQPVPEGKVPVTYFKEAPATCSVIREVSLFPADTSIEFPEDGYKDQIFRITYIRFLVGGFQGYIEQASE